MNKISKVLTGVCAVALCACSSDEPMTGNGGEQIPTGPTGDTAYLAIDIRDANYLGRGTDGGFDYGEDEQAVSNAYFYFYDEAGNFVSEANLWQGGKPNEENPDGNVEFFGQSTVILSGLTNKSFPSYVVTVLNRPEKNADGKTFAPGATLNEMANILVDSYKSGDNFIMTTSSWRGASDDHSDAYYFATKLHEKNFFNEMPDYEDMNSDELADRVLDIYVERLAVKVRVKLANNFKTESIEVNGKTQYKLGMTAAGKPNAGEGDDKADTDLYVTFEGWALNSTAKNSYMSKNLDGLTESIAIDGWKNWNQPSLHRSYWGKATTYGLSGDALTASLNELAIYADLTNEIGGVEYCLENTNLVENITSDGLVVPSKTTSVLLKATVRDIEGNPVDLVNYQGLNFTKERFIDYVMQSVNPQYFTRVLSDGVTEGDPNITDANYDYTPIAVADVELAAAGLGTGTVNVALTADAAAKTWYTVTMGADGKVATATAVTATDINNRLASATPANNKAVAATEGSTYYPIAIEHLNNPTLADDGAINAQYGVVRNHCYEITINEVKALGNGVFNIDPIEGEPLNPDDVKKPKYYVGAMINILSWKIVEQGVTLD